MTVISELPQSSVRLKRHIFIGSSVEGLGRAREIAALINDDATECRLWNTTFEPGYTAFDALERMLTECCAAVFIVTPDDKATIRGRTVAVPRANIMLEFGLVAGRLGRHNIAICQYGGAELPSDLKGLTVIEMEPGQPPPCGTESDADGFKLRAEDTLTKWSARLLPTAEMIPRTATVHGYTGRWTFDLHLDHWRGLEISNLSYCQANGSIELYIDATGVTGHGFIFGHLTFKLVPLQAPAQPAFQGELRFCHQITNLVCDRSGGVRFTSRAFALMQVNAFGTPLPEIGSLADVPEPWPFVWDLRPSADPRSLEGTIDAENPGRTTGALRAIKND
jgi:hypothetical protein